MVLTFNQIKMLGSGTKPEIKLIDKMHKSFISKRQVPQHYKIVHFVVSFNVFSGEVAFILILDFYVNI